jgi:hypothetical protein
MAKIKIRDLCTKNHVEHLLVVDLNEVDTSRICGGGGVSEDGTGTMSTPGLGVGGSILNPLAPVITTPGAGGTST